jgi:hypothetical protein
LEDSFIDTIDVMEERTWNTDVDSDNSHEHSRLKAQIRAGIATQKKLVAFFSPLPFSRQRSAGNDSIGEFLGCAGCDADIGGWRHHIHFPTQRAEALGNQQTDTRDSLVGLLVPGRISSGQNNQSPGRDTHSSGFSISIADRR